MGETGGEADAGFTDVTASKFWNFRLDLGRLYEAVPLGESNAATSRQVWLRLDLWSPATIAYKLKQLADDGRIKRIVLPAQKGGLANRYCRE